ncbi:MAG TPA: APC family permease [Candidatus Limnocylindrales bacterium]|jgi:amino acid transporter|nr:APC family permease [Candidatus Limnocylindrales bacterium]
MIGGRRSLPGRKLGDRRVRVERPHSAYFRWTGPGQLTAKEAASVPSTPAGKAWARIRGLLLGRPLASEEEIGERLSKKKALAIFSSDAISSSAYATEEILRVLILGGVAALAWGLWVSVAIAVLLIAVAISYRQICLAYPTGGGSYSVSKRNFGQWMSLVAASALMIDYVMTVAVSTASSIEQVTSALPFLMDQRVLLGVLAIALITIGNLRGLREAGNLFAIPTYLFLGSALLMITIGTIRIVVFNEHGEYSQTLLDQVGSTAQPLSIILLLRAFAAGAVALTGTEAIATGVPAFQPPEAKNAATTLSVMAALLGVLFIGLTFLAVNLGLTHIDLPEKQTVISQIAREIYGDGTIPFFLFQAFTALLLVLAANTSFNAFPRLLAILASDGFAPRQFAFRGDRLAFSYGIIVLASLAASLIVLFGGETHLLIPLYAVGVFIDFTISQSGMIRHWRRERPHGWRRRLAINAFGCALTAIVAVVVTIAKAPQSLIVIVLIPVLVGLMAFIHRQYVAQEEELHVREDLVIEGPHREQRVVVPVNGINRAVVQAVNFGRTLATDVRAVYVTEDPEQGEALRKRWARQFPGVPLVIVESPYRALIGPVTAYLDVLDLAWPPDKPAPVTIVVLPEYVARHWWDRVLYNQSAKRLKAALLGRDHTVIADVPYRRGH